MNVSLSYWGDSGIETGWDLEPFTAVLAHGQTSAQATKYEETIWD